MKMATRFIILIMLLSNVSHSFAQKINGTWEGYMDQEFIQINIEQKANQLCGYTYDYERINRASHCIATFDGYYDPESKLYFIAGKKFIENSGSHVRMRMMLAFASEEGRIILIGQVTTEVTGGFMQGRVDMKLRRVSARPQQLQGIMEPCFPKPPRPAVKQPATKAPIVKSPVATPKPAPVDPMPVVKQPQPVSPPKVRNQPPQPLPAPKIKSAPAPRDSSVPTIVRPLQSGLLIPNREILQSMKLRKKSEQNRLEVNVKKINLKVYDNGVVDNDTVSIFYNGQLLLSHQRLSETAIEFEIELKDDVERHEIIMYAENLGGIPPNTALIVVTAGDKRYELRSKASLEENAVLTITYKPKSF